MGDFVYDVSPRRKKPAWYLCLEDGAVQIKVLLTKDVDNLGKAGEVRRVAQGYARNFLFPRGLAMPPTEGAVRHVEIMKRADSKRNAKLTSDAQELATKLAARALKFTAKVGEQGRLYGSITSQDIADQLKEQWGLDVDRRKIELAEPLKQIGEHQVPLHLHGEVRATVNVQIAAEAEPSA